MIAEYIRDGKIVPMEVTISLLRNAIQCAIEERSSTSNPGWGDSRGRFLIDGFPRKLDQSHKFEETVCPAQMVLFLQCPEDVMLKRLLQRGQTSGRTDDNIESIRKRFRTFVETSMPVVDHLRTQDKVVDIDAVNPVDDVYKDICRAMDTKFSQLTEQKQKE